MSRSHLPLLETASKPSSNALSPRRHQVQRSVSDFSAFPKIHRPHVHHHHRHHHGDKHHKESDVTQSAGPNLQLNGEAVGSRSENGTPNDSRDASRRTSVLGPGWEDGERDRESMVVQDGQVAEEKRKGAQRAMELRNSILDLNTLSNNTTRRLDNTYYSVLEKLSVLQNTILSMQEIAGLTKSLNEEFKTESEEVINEVQGQLEGFNGFQSQEERISALQTRVKAGRDKIGTLGERVDIIRQRVESWEKAEFEWQERTRRRFRLIWMIMSAAAVVFIALILFRYTPARAPATSYMRGRNTSAVPDFGKLENETLRLRNKTAKILDGLRQNEEGRLEEDPRLKIFDEL